MSYDLIIDRFSDFAKTFEGDVILRMRDAITGKIYRVRIKPSAVRELYRMVEASRRANYQEAVAIVQSAKARFERFLQEIGKEYTRQRKFGDFVVHYYIPPSRMTPGNAVFFVPRVVLEEEAKRWKEVANSPTFNPSGDILSVVAAAATHEALEVAENFFQIYDVSAGKKGRGYDSPLVMRFFEVTYSLVFKRSFYRNPYLKRHDPQRVGEEPRYYEETIPCPSCGKDAIMRHIVRKIPYYGELRILSISCPHCGYRFSDVYLLREEKPKRIEFKIKNLEDLSAMLVLTSRATVKIPELGLEVRPGPIAKGRMLPVSAMLTEFIDATRFAMKGAKGDEDEEERVRRGKEIIKRLEKELEEPSGELTIVIEDPSGGSDIIPEKIRSMEAERERKKRSFWVKLIMSYKSCSMTTKAVVVRNLVKRYKNVVALRGVSFEVPTRIVYTILGPNGSGKSTLLNIIAGMLKPTSGYVEVLGIDVVRDPFKVRPLVGIVLGGKARAFYPRLTALENLIVFGILYGLSEGEARKRAKELLSLVGLERAANKTLNEFSLGMTMRLMIARALIHDPELLILDEPTLGLDPIAAYEFRRLIKKLSKERTILLTTHNMYEAEEVSDRVTILLKGKIVEQGTPDIIREKYAKPEFEVEYEGDVELPGVIEERRLNDRRIVRVRGTFEEIVERLKGCNVYRIERRIPSLEEVFMEVVVNDTRPL